MTKEKTSKNTSTLMVRIDPAVHKQLEEVMAKTMTFRKSHVVRKALDEYIKKVLKN